MAHLNAIAATSTVRFWWRSSTLAARWRDGSTSQEIIRLPARHRRAFLFQVTFQ
jgi:hypothetical protein